MVVFSRIHLTVSSLWAFLFRRHTVFYPSQRFFANNSIYIMVASSISFMTKSITFSGCVCHIFCFLVAFEGSLQGLKLGYNMSSALMSPIFVFLFYSKINDNVLLNFKYKWRNFHETHESIFKQRLTYLVLNSFIFRYFFKKFGTNFRRVKV